MKRIKLRLADLNVVFTDRDIAVRQIEELADRGTYPVYVIYGPEGCGKTALFRQAKAALEEWGYYVVYFSPLEKEAMWRLSITEDARELVEPVLSVALGESGARFVEKAIEIAAMLMRYREKIAVLADDIFQAIGLGKAEMYVKMLLNLIEYPNTPIEKVVILVGSSEGMTRSRIGRHNWATIWGMWNMPREGFRLLYEQLPGEKPGFEEVWMWTGGNPRYLSELYEAGWDVEAVVRRIFVAGVKPLVSELTPLQQAALEEAVDDPDTLLRRLREAEDKRPMIDLINKLVEQNLVVTYLPPRERLLWIDQPPPVDRELGVGEDFAWQTPLHREAARRALEAR
ncbi:ATP-binding protein [Infirmifilum lucidum]|uniref:ATP-binding protein n=1 Tax=Infirmifilum lucidum TaxID=2776706 RepID=A0A7L9FHS7_9CREN|nr:ATP-binding protein [Infirmifilum lucidum]QOJ79277.1 ATP-binding protein [Infirmifilum lucidum]